MKKLGIIGVGIVAAGALAAGCSKSSTGPSDPFAGAWSVSVGSLIYNFSPPDTGTVTPSPFTLTITKGAQGGYTATWPALTWTLKVAGTYVIPSSSTANYTLAVSGDTLVIHVPPPTWLDQTCELRFTGVFTGRNAQGSVNMVNGNCGTVGNDGADGSWTATKQ
jgi:hypothetical protein